MGRGVAQGCSDSEDEDGGDPEQRRRHIKRCEVVVEETYADITLAGEVLGWKPEVSIDEGVTRLVAWIKENRL